MDARPDEPEAGRLLRAYLRDHLVVATASIELCARTLEENRGTPFERALTAMLRDLEEDREALRGVCRAVGYPPPRRAEAAAWILEKVGRLKRNGRLFGYSPLSRMVELEALAVLAEQRKLFWRTLAVYAGKDARLEGAALSRRADLAREHQERLEARLLDAADRALGLE